MKRCRFCGYEISRGKITGNWWSREISSMGGKSNGFYCSGELGTREHEPTNFIDYLKQVELCCID